jgi:hypothetical protein
MMIRPTRFARNEVTKPTNHFQSAAASADPRKLAATAVAEFNALVAALTARGISVYAFEGRTMTDLPDEVFCNNWISTHADGTVVLYPMMAWNRRPERRRDIIADLQQRTDGFRIERVVDLSILESKNHYLEGTGSLVIDHANSIAFACRSARTHKEALYVYAKRLSHGIISFDGTDRDGRVIYHTNVVMSLGKEFAVVCLAAIADVKERYRVLRRLEQSGREIIELSFDQMHAFAANLIELEGNTGKFILLSAQAEQSLSREQKESLGKFGQLVPVRVDTIEKYGGGSVRCMLTEIFLPYK